MSYKMDHNANSYWIKETPRGSELHDLRFKPRKTIKLPQLKRMTENQVAHAIYYVGDKDWDVAGPVIFAAKEK